MLNYNQIKDKAAVLLALIPLSVLNIFTIQKINNAGYDFREFYAGAYLVSQHLNPYDPNVYTIGLAKAGFAPEHIPPHMLYDFVSPPWFALLMQIFTRFSPGQALILWWVVLFCGTSVAIWLSLKLWLPSLQSGKERAFYTACILISPALIWAYSWGNVSCLTFLSFVLWCYFLSRNQKVFDYLSGAAMFFGTLKPQLLLPLALITICAFIIPSGERLYRLIRILAGFLFISLIAIFLIFKLLGSAILFEWIQSLLNRVHLISFQYDIVSIQGVYNTWIDNILPMSYARTLIFIISLCGVIIIIRTYPFLKGLQPLQIIAILSSIWVAFTPYIHSHDETLLIPAVLTLIPYINSIKGRFGLVEVTAITVYTSCSALLWLLATIGPVSNSFFMLLSPGIFFSATWFYLLKFRLPPKVQSLAC